jgi:hypothetical protein
MARLVHSLASVTSTSTLHGSMAAESVTWRHAAFFDAFADFNLSVPAERRTEPMSMAPTLNFVRKAWYSMLNDNPGQKPRRRCALSSPTSLAHERGSLLLSDLCVRRRCVLRSDGAREDR